MRKYGFVLGVLFCLSLLLVSCANEEQPTIERLHRFIKESGYEIGGVHEEEYLTRPNVKVPKTVVRYPVKRIKGK